ncbi:efflux transporter outer membrane subunit [Legionella fairfieldensis]|uniref:efflux transporter outer membrane subunit n=1 Tax=Legionella fairfieldensis TaxID=45064 RepID=UPI000AF024C8|nr:efflux transporter outer membrane subunit [Legionella fairfieldensis]
MKINKKMTKLVFSVLILMLAACSLAPRYQRPLMVIPPQYKETAGWKPAQSAKQLTKAGRWWRMFNDPVLNALEEKLTCANQDLKVAFARYQKAQALVQVARSAYYPSIMGIANADTQETSRHVANVNSNTRFSDFMIGANLNYEVDLWGRVRNSVASSEYRAEASESDLAGVSLSLHALLAADYFTLRGEEEAQRILDRTVIAYQKALYLTRKRHDGGVSSVADVYQAETQLENAKTLATDMRLARAQLEHAIAILTGEVPANFKMPKAQVAMNPIVVAPVFPSVLLERRPDIAAAEQRVQAANAEIGVACAAFFPQIIVPVIGGFESQSLGNLISKPSLFWSLGPLSSLNLVQPMVKQVLFDGGRLKGLLNAAKASYHETVALYRQTVLNAFQEVEDNLVAVHRLEQETRSQTAATRAAKLSLVQANKRYEGGITNYLDVIVNENIALQSELALVDIHIRRQLASVQLIKALGGGWSGCKRQCISIEQSVNNKV